MEKLGTEAKIQDLPISHVKVRRAKIEDVTFFAEFAAKLALETEGKVCDTAQMARVTSLEFQYPERTSFWIASYQGEDVGSMFLTTEYNIVKNRYYLWFQTVYIHSEFRGKKIFNEMFKCAESYAKSLGYNGLKLFVERENKVARAVYQKKGLKFPRCEILESDLTYAFNSLEYTPEKLHQNYLTFL